MDSYTDDYYCHKWNQRLVGGERVGDAGSSLVAPVWTETKNTPRPARRHMASDLKNVTRKWEEGNKVLGHVKKTNVAGPELWLTVGDATSAVGQRCPSRRTCGSRGGPATRESGVAGVARGAEL